MDRRLGVGDSVGVPTGGQLVSKFEHVVLIACAYSNFLVLCPDMIC